MARHLCTKTSARTRRRGYISGHRLRRSLLPATPSKQETSASSPSIPLRAARHHHPLFCSSHPRPLEIARRPAMATTMTTRPPAAAAAAGFLMLAAVLFVSAAVATADAAAAGREGKGKHGQQKQQQQASVYMVMVRPPAQGVDCEAYQMGILAAALGRYEPDRRPELQSIIGIEILLFHVVDLVSMLCCKSQSEARAKAALVYSYKTVVSGFAAKLTPAQAAALQSEFHFHSIIPLPAGFSLMCESDHGVGSRICCARASIYGSCAQQNLRQMGCINLSSLVNRLCLTVEMKISHAHGLHMRVNPWFTVN